MKLFKASRSTTAPAALASFPCEHCSIKHASYMMHSQSNHPGSLFSTQLSWALPATPKITSRPWVPAHGHLSNTYQCHEHWHFVAICRSTALQRYLQCCAPRCGHYTLSCNHGCHDASPTLLQSLEPQNSGRAVAVPNAWCSSQDLALQCYHEQPRARPSFGCSYSFSRLTRGSSKPCGSVATPSEVSSTSRRKGGGAIIGGAM